jgi:hypothetical protein
MHTIPFTALPICPASSPWPATPGGQTQTIACNSGYILRMCGWNGVWGAVNTSACFANIGASCALATTTCLGNSNCTADSSGVTVSGLCTRTCACTQLCTCTPGYKNQAGVCQLMSVSPGQACNHGELCMGNSTCNGIVCVCTAPEYLSQDPLTLAGLCVTGV